MDNKNYILLGVLLFGLSVPSFGAWSKSSRSTTNSEITLSTVTSHVRTIIDDRYSTSGTVRYSSNTIYDLVNTAQRIICITTYCLQASATQTLTADTTEYLLPDDCIAVTRVTLDELDGNGPQYIPYVSVHHLDVDKGTAWAVVESTPTAYYIRNRSIGMYPFPEYGTATLGVWYIKTPDLMTAEGSYVFDGWTPLEAYWHSLAAYAAYQILLAEGRTGQLDKLASEFAGAIEGIKLWVHHKPDAEIDFTGSTYK